MSKHDPDELNKILFHKVNQAISLHAIGENKKAALALAGAARILDRWDRLVKAKSVKKEKEILPKEESVVEDDSRRRQGEGADKKVQVKTSPKPQAPRP